jgi:opacity protein-like surface antigen
MKKTYIIILLAFLAIGSVQAQGTPASLGYKPSSYYTFSWNMTFPMGDFHDWVKEAGLAGFDIGGRYFINHSGLAAGFNISWNRVAAQYDNETYTVPDKGIAITATNYRFTWMVPFQAVIAYHFNTEKMISPYVGLGIGGDYMEHHLMIQEYDLYKERWDFSLTPEVGALVKFGNYSSWGGLVAFNYKWTTNKIEFYEKESTNLSMLSLKVGIAYIIR